MPAADSSALIVARFLKSNHYNESYEAFIAEAGLPGNAGDVSRGDLTLERLLEEKKTFDMSVRFEKLGTSNGADGWTEPAPVKEDVVTTLPSKSNLLSTSVEIFKDHGGASQSVLLATSADRRLHILDAATLSLKASFSGLQDSPILSCAVVNERILLTTSMSGQLVACNVDGNILDQRRDHSKYLVKVIAHCDQSSGDVLVATAGWDNKINLYRPELIPDGSKIEIGDPVSTISLQTKPEAILFIRHPEDSQPILLVSRADSNHIFYYTTHSEPRLLGKQNLAPHSNAWIAFTPSSLALCPTDATLLAVGTNSVPHMKLLVVRLLVPPYEGASDRIPTASPMAALLDPDHVPTETQASQARAALAVTDKEAAAIVIHCTTLAPQTAYSTPAVAWRPDGSGVWVNGDDGAVRGIEASSGKIVATLRGHEQGSKVRCLWAGSVNSGNEGDEEWLVSGGFDQRLIVCRTPKA